MSTNLKEFQRDLNLFTSVFLPRAHVEHQKKIIVKMYELCAIENIDMPRHPIDTGWAQRNWRISVRTIPSNTLGNRDDVPHPPPRTEAQLRAQMSNLRPYQVVWIFNNVPYMQELENGRSWRWAPYGIVEPALYQIEDYIKTLK